MLPSLFPINMSFSLMWKNKIPLFILLTLDMIFPLFFFFSRLRFYNCSLGILSASLLFHSVNIFTFSQWLYVDRQCFTNAIHRSIFYDCCWILQSCPQCLYTCPCAHIHAQTQIGTYTDTYFQFFPHVSLSFMPQHMLWYLIGVSLLF